ESSLPYADDPDLVPGQDEGPVAGRERGQDARDDALQAEVRIAGDGAVVAELGVDVDAHFSVDERRVALRLGRAQAAGLAQLDDEGLVGLDGRRQAGTADVGLAVDAGGVVAPERDGGHEGEDREGGPA